MKASQKQKLCAHCDARISWEATVCPFCALDPSKEKTKSSSQTPLFQSQSLEDSLASLYTPPYQGRRPSFSQTEETPVQEEPLAHLKPLYTENSLYKEPISSAPFEPLIQPQETPSKTSSQNILTPILLLLSGVNCFFLGLMQLLFSHHGKLSLEWDASYWFFYCLISSPLLFFGYKKLQKL